MFDTLAYVVTVFYRSFVSYTSNRLETLGLHFGSLFLILYVGKHPGCSQAQLTTALNLDWGYSQRRIQKLVEDGWITREKWDRSYHLALSPKGEEAFAVGHQVFFDWDAEMLSPLEDTERAQLWSLLEKIVQKKEGSPGIKPSTDRTRYEKTKEQTTDFE